MCHLTVEGKLKHREVEEHTERGGHSCKVQIEL